MGEMADYYKLSMMNEEWEHLYEDDEFEDNDFLFFVKTYKLHKSKDGSIFSIHRGNPDPRYSPMNDYHLVNILRYLYKTGADNKTIQPYYDEYKIRFDKFYEPEDI